MAPEPLVPGAVVGALVADAIARDGQASWVARGSSMGGAIADGERIHLVTPGSLRVGQVAMAVLGDGTLVVHRIRKLGDGLVVLRGDTCRRSDPPVPADHIVAVVEPTPAPTPIATVYSLLSHLP